MLLSDLGKLSSELQSGLLKHFDVYSELGCTKIPFRAA